MANILVAEDEPALARLIARTLDSIGHKISVCANGRIASEKLSAPNDFDMLITDVCMPEVSGLQLIEHIRKSPELRHMPVIIMSGNVAAREISEFLDLGASCYLGKPVNVHELRQYVDLLLSGSLTKSD